MSMPPKSTLAGGAGVIEYLMRTRLYRQLTEAQAAALWLDCKAALQRRDLQETVDECDTCRGGSLDTLPRGDVLDVLAQVLTGQDWPLNMTSEAESDRFLGKLKAAFEERAYVRAEARA